MWPGLWFTSNEALLEEERRKIAKNSEIRIREREERREEHKQEEKRKGRKR